MKIPMANKQLFAALRRLQGRFARIGERASRARRERRGIKAKLVRSVDRVSLRIYKERNHRLPHFHIEFKKQYTASYDIATGERLAGNIPVEYEEAMLEWAQTNKALLLREWNALNSEGDLQLTLERARN